jgi:hypothetical protein
MSNFEKMCIKNTGFIIVFESPPMLTSVLPFDFPTDTKARGPYGGKLPATLSQSEAISVLETLEAMRQSRRSCPLGN